MISTSLIFIALLNAGPGPTVAGKPSADHGGAGASQQVRRFALVIGSNHALDRGQQDLKYADDDATKVAEALTDAGVEVELVATLDRETQDLHSSLVAGTHVATLANVQSQWQGLRGRMEAAKGEGDRVEFLLFYSGHGDVGPDGQGYLTLDDGKFTRSDLFGKMLATSPAHHNHIMVDACRSEAFVLSRGSGPWKSDQALADYGDAVGRYLDRQHLGAFPNTGVILAHSIDQQTHEWQRYRGGIFTHELVSGLRGGADLNGDGQIEYSELGAFVAAANSAVVDPRARLQVVVRPPASDERRAIIGYDAVADSRVLLLAGTGADLFTIENSRGVRVADLRPSGERPGYLRLPSGPLLVIRERQVGGATLQEESQIAADQGGVLLAKNLQFSASSRQSRGAMDDALRAGLFAVPFGLGYYVGYTDRTGFLGVRELSWHDEVWRAPEAEPAADDADGGDTSDIAKRESGGVDDHDGEDDKDDHHHDYGDGWGGLFLGTVITPYAPAGRINVDGVRRVTANQFSGEVGATRAAAFRGMDLRWQLYGAKGARDFPRWVAYFRTGYTAGQADFTRSAALRTGDATSLTYVTVPLFFGGSIYLFERFPLRPYAGLGFGFDVMRLAYRRHQDSTLKDVSARIGFELHAGLEARISNYVSLSAEIMQLWSARRKISHAPDLSNEGFTVITGISTGFPLWKGERDRAKGRRANK